MKAIRWLLVIDFPDERVRRDPEYDHMHSWMTSEGEAQQMSRVLADRIGGDHVVVGPPAMCPRCGAWPKT